MPITLFNAINALAIMLAVGQHERMVRPFGDISSGFPDIDGLAAAPGKAS